MNAAVNPLKAFGRSPLAGKAASLAIRSYIGLVAGTSRFEFVGRDHGDALDRGRTGYILAFWHSRLLMGAILRKETDRRVKMLSSAHRDGDIIADAVRPYGIEFIRGSAANPKKPEKNKSGASAVMQMIGALAEGAIVGMTPDGPRGPSRTVKPGVIQLAALSGAPILPGAYATSRGWELSTWDRFFLAAPFSKGVFLARPPIRVRREADKEELEAARLLLESELNEAQRLAELHVGYASRRSTAS